MKGRFLRQSAASLPYRMMSVMTAAQTSGDIGRASTPSSPLTLIATVLLLIFSSLPAASAQQKTANDASALLAEARTLWRKGERETAFDAIRKAISLNPQDPVLHVELARMYMELGKNDEARSAVDEALKINPNYAPARQKLGSLLRRMKDFQGAIREAQLALSLKPDAEVAANSHLTIGLALEEMKRRAEADGELRKAAEGYSEVTRLNPNDATAHQTLGYVLFQSHRYEEAEAAYRRAIELSPNDAGMLLDLAGSLHNQGKKDEAVHHYQEYLRLNPNAEDRPGVEARINWLQTVPLPELLGHLLLHAAENGDTANAKILLTKGASANFKDNYRTPLNQAAAGGHAEVVKLLLAHGATDTDATALARAYVEGHAEVEALLERAARKPRSPEALNRLLSAAVHKGDIKKADALLAAGADDKDEALLSAVNRDNASVEMVRLLLDKGANANAPTKYKTPLMHAAEKGHAGVVKLLLAKGANVNALTDEGTALMLAAAGGRADVVKLLLAAGAQVNAKDRLERTALLVSAMLTVPKVNPQSGTPPARPSSEVMQLLLAGGADANSKERWGKTALMLANSADKVRLLIANGANVNAKDQEGQTALMEAADRGDAEIVDALLAGGADVNARGAKGATALILAFKAERPGPQVKVKSSDAVVQLLLSRNADTNVQNKDGETALMRAVKLADVEAIKLLLARGADVGAVDALGNTAMVFAYIDGNTEIEKLLKSSAPTRQTPDTVNAFLRAAVEKKDAARVNELLAHGADPNFDFPIGYSHMDIKDNVLVMAARAGHAGIVQMLLDKGADVNARGLVYGSESGIKFGTALEAAEFSRQPEVVALLKKAAAKK